MWSFHTILFQASQLIVKVHFTRLNWNYLGRYLTHIWWDTQFVCTLTISLFREKHNSNDFGFPLIYLLEILFILFYCYIYSPVLRSLVPGISSPLLCHLSCVFLIPFRHYFSRTLSRIYFIVCFGVTAAFDLALILVFIPGNV